MVLVWGGKINQRSDGKWILYISKKLADDSAWPFPEGTQEVKIVIVENAARTEKYLVVRRVKPMGEVTSGSKSN